MICGHYLLFYLLDCMQMPKISVNKREQVICLHTGGSSQRKIANQLKIAQTSVSYLIKKHKAGIGMDDTPRTGRPKKLTARQERRLIIESKKCNDKTANELRKEVGLENIVSTSTVKRCLRKNGLFGRVAAKKPALTNKQRRNRKQWCLERRNWNTTDWSKIIFSDECKINLHSCSRKYVRRKVGERFKEKNLQPSRKFSPSVMVWGAIRCDGKRVLILCPDNVDSIAYQSILDEGLPQIYSTRHVFQQDGASCHTSRSTVQYLEQKAIRVLRNWPSQSPDLSPIENLWDELKVSLGKLTFKDKAELWQAAKNTFYAIPNEKILRLYESLPRRVSHVILAKGGNTKY